MRRFDKLDQPMPTNTKKSKLEQALQERLQAAPPPDWVREMIEHYRRTGTYRAKDLRRLLDDPTKGVDVGPEASLSSLLVSQQEHTS